MKKKTQANSLQHHSFKVSNFVLKLNNNDINNIRGSSSNSNSSTSSGSSSKLLEEHTIQFSLAYLSLLPAITCPLWHCL